MIIAGVALQKIEMEPLKDEHQHQKTLPQDKTTLVQEDCKPQKIRNTVKPNRKYINYKKTLERVLKKKKKTHTKQLQQWRRGGWRRLSHALDSRI